MEIYPIIVINAVDSFVALFNKGEIAKACELFDPAAIWEDEKNLFAGRNFITDFLEMKKRHVTNHHVDMVNVSCDRQHAIAFVQFTLGHTLGEDYYRFPQSCSSMLFKVEEDRLLVSSITLITQKDC